MVAEALKLPNKTHPNTPIGDERKNRLIREVDSKLKVNNEIDCTHVEIAELFDLADFNSASKLTGHKFVFLKNEAALLEMALCNWALNLLAKKGYTPILPPEIAR